MSAIYSHVGVVNFGFRFICPTWTSSYLMWLDFNTRYYIIVCPWRKFGNPCALSTPAVAQSHLCDLRKCLFPERADPLMIDDNTAQWIHLLNLVMNTNIGYMGLQGTITFSDGRTRVVMDFITYSWRIISTTKSGQSLILERDGCELFQRDVQIRTR